MPANRPRARVPLSGDVPASVHPHPSPSTVQEDEGLDQLAMQSKPLVLQSEIARTLRNTTPTDKILAQWEDLIKTLRGQFLEKTREIDLTIDDVLADIAFNRVTEVTPMILSHYYAEFKSDARIFKMNSKSISSIIQAHDNGDNSKRVYNSAIDFYDSVSYVEKIVKRKYDYTTQFLRGRIADKEQSITPQILARKLKQVDEFAEGRTGIEVAGFVKRLFGDLGSPAVGPRPPLPEQAPVKWSRSTRLVTDEGPEDAPQFIKRVYGQWLGQGFTLAHLRNLDNPLLQALERWRKKNPSIDDGLDLPTLQEQNTRDIALWTAQAPGGEELGTHALREAQRLARAAQRRAQK